MTQHAHGVDNVQALANLALARGWVGRPGGGLLPIRGHSNVQGVGSVGVTPALKAEFARRLGELYGVRAAGGAGAAHAGERRGGGRGPHRRGAAARRQPLLGHAGPRAWPAAALRRIGTTVSITTKLNESHVHGRGRTHAGAAGAGARRGASVHHAGEHVQSRPPLRRRRRAGVRGDALRGRDHRRAGGPRAARGADRFRDAHRPRRHPRRHRPGRAGVLSDRGHRADAPPSSTSPAGRSTSRASARRTDGRSSGPWRSRPSRRRRASSG